DSQKYVRNVDQELIWPQGTRLVYSFHLKLVYRVDQASHFRSPDDQITSPEQDCEFHGVVRFYFQDGNNVVTKCIRVASSATTQEVVDVLVEKFRPDMRMLTANKYALYEVHANGEERKLDDSERVLWVQLNWGTDVREGRFLLKRQGDTTVPHADNKENQGGTFKRKLSKREKKEAKKKEKEKKILDSGNAAEQLYTDMPETRFTRSISNPEAVMKRRRQQKVEKKLQQCRGQDGQGGTLKIYGESIKPDIPYKTLLLSTADNVRYVIKETMDKYGMDFSVNDPDDFCLVQVLVPPGEREYHGGNIGEERIMEDHECPLAIAMDFPPTKGTMMFHFRRRNDAKKPKHKKLRAVSHEELRMRSDDAPPQKLPYLVELNPDGSDNPKGKVYRLNMKFTEVGSDPSMFIKVQGPNIQPRHCVLGLVEKDGVVTVTPRSPESETHVNNQRISETTTLQNGMTVRFGKLHVFRFIDPNFEEKLKKGQVPPDGAIQKHRTPHQKPMETNFDAVRPVPAPREPRPQEPAETQRRGVPQPMGSPRREEPAYPPHRQGGDLLPAVLVFREDKEDHFFANVVLDSATAGLWFKLAPTYTIYMAVRFSLSNGYRPDLSPQDKPLKITYLVIKIANLTHQAIHSNQDNIAALAFWMANSSEILHFFKQDHDIHPFSQDAQEMLAESVQMAFHHLVRCLQYDLQRTLPAFLDDGDEDDPNDKSRMQYNRGRPTLSDVLDTLSSAMNLLRRCRVNAGLTIQLFSQLFHFINMWLFNILVKEQHQFCMRIWGVRLKRRLGSIEAWAEKQGLELAADCHLCRIIQAAHLLQAPKSSHYYISNISSTCFKLNSLQLRELLQRYIPEPGEPPVPQSLIEDIVKVAENMADELTKNDGREVCLEEHADLQLPFLLPEEGYTCDTIKGIPKGIDEFIEPLGKAGLCRLIPQPGASGDWTVYMTGDEGPKIDEAVRKGPHQPPQQQAGHHGDRPQQQLPKEPEIATVSFNKVKGSMGLSIVEATPKAREMITSECDQVKEICSTLASFKTTNTRQPAYNYDNQEIGSPFGNFGRNDYSRHEEPTRDPDVWPPPTPVEHRPGPNIRAARKPEPSRNRQAPSRPGYGDRRGPSQPSGQGRGGPGQKDNKKKQDDREKKFDPTGYDKDLVENLERDIVQENPNVSWHKMSSFNLDDELTCPICLELYDCPISLPCLHSFCTECLQDLTHSSGPTTVTCPQCRTDVQVPTGGVKNFPKNFNLANIVQKVKQHNEQKNQQK
ncbi:afadin-like, partial [Saccostrea cucullata]|uniref:afadin-like n=1 Tax=Saccostrea cuccullata TaxID=36930 RepID=UPI002ED5E508